MYEALILIVLLTVIVLAIRPGKLVVLEQPVIIESPGQYHITLAPQLVFSKEFIEKIARQFFYLQTAQLGECATQYFAVRAPEISSQKFSFYLLAIAVRKGVLYFQAINPQPLQGDVDSHLKAVRGFSDAVLAHHPLVLNPDEQSLKNLMEAVDTVVNQTGIQLESL